MTGMQKNSEEVCAGTLNAFLRPLPILLAIFAVFYAGRLFSFSLSIDDEIAAQRAVADIWVAQGRWSTYLFERFVMPRPVLPFLPLAAFGLFLSIGYLVLLRGIEKVTRQQLQLLSWPYLLVFPLFCAFPTWCFLTAFQSNTPAEGLAVLFSCVFAATLAEVFVVGASRRLFSPTIVYRIVAAGVVGAVAIGVYQTNVVLLAVLGLSLIVFETASSDDASAGDVVRAVITLAVATALSMTIYFLISKLLMIYLNKSPQYVDSLLNVDLLLRHPALVISATINEMYGVYSGSSKVYGLRAVGFGIVVALGAVGLATAAKLRRRRLARILLVTIAAIMLVMPFVLNLLSGGVMPYRSLVAVPAVMWFFGILALWTLRGLFRQAAAILIMVAGFHSIYIANIFQAGNALVRQHDLLLAGALYDRIAEQNPGFDRARQYRVDLVGAWHFPSIYPVALSSTASASFFEWDGGNPYRMLAYMRMLGFNNLIQVQPADREALASVAKAMPAWPAIGSVKVQGDVTVVKLGDIP